MIRRKWAFSIAILCLMLIGATANAAVPFPYWYSNEYAIGYLSGTSHSWATGRSTGFAQEPTYITNYYPRHKTMAQAAVNAWNILANHSFSSTTNIESAQIQIIAATRAEAQQNGVGDAVGGTTQTVSGFITDTIPGSPSVNVWLYDQEQTLIWWGDDLVGQLTQGQLAKLGAHEQGHAIGFDGEGISSTMLMYGNLTFSPSVPNPSYTPTTKDKDHMRNMYTIN